MVKGCNLQGKIGKGDEQSNDVLYWQSLCLYQMSDLTVEDFKEFDVGGYATLLSVSFRASISDAIDLTIRWLLRRFVNVVARACIRVSVLGRFAVGLLGVLLLFA